MTKHLSVRVPWNDTCWDGHFCKNPELNDSCICLSRIAEERNDQWECKQAGLNALDMAQSEWPPCIVERGAFMSSTGYDHTFVHPYCSIEGYKKDFEHFRPTRIRIPAHSTTAVPFRYMLRRNLPELRRELSLDLEDENDSQEDYLKSAWTQKVDNQKALLDSFFSSIKKDESLVFFYAKQVPFVESNRSVIIGVGKIKNIADGREYDYSKKGPGLRRSMIWERMITHSIRPDMVEGFLMPYHELLEGVNNGLDINPADFVVFSPEDRHAEFTYASEIVTNDAAIDVLTDCRKKIRAVQQVIRGPWESAIKWIDEEISRIWKLRGEYPGLGSCLRVMGVESGLLIARSIDNHKNQDSWALVDKALTDPQSILSKDLASKVGINTKNLWKVVKSKPERLQLLKLLSRMEITVEQAMSIYDEKKRADLIELEGVRVSMGGQPKPIDDKEFIENPYRIFELTRQSASPISIWTVDKGITAFDGRKVGKEFEKSMSLVSEPNDRRRVRAILVEALEKASNEGHTMLPEGTLLKRLEDQQSTSSIVLNPEVLEATMGYLGGVIEVTVSQEMEKKYQLTRYKVVGKIIRDYVEGRVKAPSIPVSVDWKDLLDKKIAAAIKDEREKKARQEKIAALEILAKARFSVLVGKAGTGKTFLLSALCNSPVVASGGILLLAPTGKARVRLARETGMEALTIAQFLYGSHRFDAETQRYHISSTPGRTEQYQTVIIDESSMLTEEMLASLIDSLKRCNVKRMILVGDPRQLPPIGAGKPFVDIAKHLCPTNIDSSFPKTGPAYAELTVQMRQDEKNETSRNMAAWFSGDSIEPTDDEFLNNLQQKKHPDLKIEHWTDAVDLQTLLASTLLTELKLNDQGDVDGFDVSLGGHLDKDHHFTVGCASGAEKWQILSPLRNGPNGSRLINWSIHETYRKATLEEARKPRSSIPRPAGNEEVVYGDKVINIFNHWNRNNSPQDKGYIANGEIGLVVGRFGPGHRQSIWIEFSSQPRVSYYFWPSDFGDEDSTAIELAYALTVHKAQGSEFNLVILILPDKSPLLTREMLYTAFTRQTGRLVILSQMDIPTLRGYSSSRKSELAQRITNLMNEPVIRLIDDRPYDTKYVFVTKNNSIVSSKNEMIIADALSDHGFDFVYDEPMMLGNRKIFPDFRFEDSNAGITYYWEHLGRTDDEKYMKKWKWKEKLYHDNGILPHEKGGGPNGNLIVTVDSPEHPISSREIDQLVRKIKDHNVS